MLKPITSKVCIYLTFYKNKITDFLNLHYPALIHKWEMIHHFHFKITHSNSMLIIPLNTHQKNFKLRHYDEGPTCPTCNRNFSLSRNNIFIKRIKNKYSH